MSATLAQLDERTSEQGKLLDCHSKAIDECQDKLSKREGTEAGWRLAQVFIWGLIVILWGLVMYNLTRIESNVDKLMQMRLHDNFQTKTETIAKEQPCKNLTGDAISAASSSLALPLLQLHSSRQ